MPQALAHMPGSVLGAEETNIKSKLLPAVPASGPVSLWGRLITLGEVWDVMGMRRAPRSAWGEGDEKWDGPGRERCGQIQGGRQREGPALPQRPRCWRKGGGALFSDPPVSVIVGFLTFLPKVDWELLKRQETSKESPVSCLAFPPRGCPTGGSAPVHSPLNSPTSNPALQPASLLSPPSQETVGFYVHLVPEPET